MLSSPPLNIRMKKPVMRPFRAPRKTGDKTQETKRKVSPRKDKQARQEPQPESEESTELGLVWPQPQEQVVAEESSNPWWPELPSNEKGVSEVQCNGNSVNEEESPRLTDYESEGYIARREARLNNAKGIKNNRKFSEGFRILELARQKQKIDLALKHAKVDLQKKDKIWRKAQADLAKAQSDRDKRQVEQTISSDDDDDNVPFLILPL